MRDGIDALVAEDEPMLAEVVCWSLEDAGLNVIHAVSGDEAARMLEDRSFDILVTDIRMPGATNGWMLAEKARKKMPNIPIVFISGYGPDRPALPARSVFLQKPFRPEQLIAAVDHVRNEPASGFQ